jgi:hypothetical protein
MARIFDTTCGDIYDTSTIMQFWDNAQPGGWAPRVIDNEPGATGQCIVCDGLSYSSNGFLRKVLPNTYTRLIVGLRFKYSALPSYGARGVCVFWDAFGTSLMDVQLFPDGSLSLWRNGVQVGGSSAFTPPGVIHANTWAHLGLDITFSTTSGNAQMWVNSVSRLNLTGVPTSANSNPVSMFSIFRGGGSPDDNPISYFDDIYVNDTSGSTCNSFQGDLQGLAFLPSGVGQFTQWSIGGSAPAATNWQSVDDVAPDGDTTFVSAGSTGLKDTYGVGNLPSNVMEIVSVSTALYAKTDSAGSGAGAKIAAVIGNGTTTSTGTDFSLNTGYAYGLQYYGTNPLTATAWSLTDWPNIEVGQVRTS